MAIIQRIMKSFSRPEGNDTVKYEIVDEAVRNALPGKADKITGGVEDNFVSIDDEGNIKDSGHKASDFITDKSDKADKVSGATNGNLAGLDENGNLTDSGYSVDDTSTDATKLWSAQKTNSATTELKSAIDGKASIIRDTVQNVAIASVPDAASNLPLTALRFAVNPIQAGSGDPYPAGGGKNLFNPNSTANEWVETNRTLSTRADAKSVRIACSEGDTFTLSQKNESSSSNVMLISYLDSSDNVLTRNVKANGDKVLTATAPADATVCLASFILWSATDEQQLEKASSASTYAPYSNIRPITGRTSAVVSVSGVNVWDEEWEVGNYDSTTGQKNPVSNQIRSKNYIPVLPNTTYYFNTGTNSRILYYKLDKTYISSELKNSATFTTPADCYFVNFHLGTAYGTTYHDDISINYPSTDTAYHAYTGTTHTVQFGNTVYGGYVDWVGAECVSGWALATANVTSESGTVLTDFKRISIAVTADISNRTKAICNVTGTYKAAFSEDSLHFYITNTGTLCCVFVPKDFEGEVQVCYPMATPVTIPLSDLDEIRTVKGQMNLWSDSGDIELMEYPCDTKLYVDKKIAETVALILEN